MTAAHPPLALTVAGRSPFDEVRVRGGGILVALLGGATLALSRRAGAI